MSKKSITTVLNAVEHLMQISAQTGVELPVISFETFQHEGQGVTYLSTPHRGRRTVMVRYGSQTYMLTARRQANEGDVKGTVDQLEAVFRKLQEPGLMYILKVSDKAFLDVQRANPDWDVKVPTELSDLPEADNPLAQARSIVGAHPPRPMQFTTFWSAGVLKSLKQPDAAPILARRGKGRVKVYMIIPVFLWTGQRPGQSVLWDQLGTLEELPSFFTVKEAAKGKPVFIVVHDPTPPKVLQGEVRMAGEPQKKIDLLKILVWEDDSLEVQPGDAPRVKAFKRSMHDQVQAFFQMERDKLMPPPPPESLAKAPEPKLDEFTIDHAALQQLLERVRQVFEDGVDRSKKAISQASEDAHRMLEEGLKKLLQSKPKKRS